MKFHHLTVSTMGLRRPRDVLTRMMLESAVPGAYYYNNGIILTNGIFFIFAGTKTTLAELVVLLP